MKVLPTLSITSVRRSAFGQRNQETKSAEALKPSLKPVLHPDTQNTLKAFHF